VFANTDVVQTGNGNEQGPYTLDSVRGLVFEGNTTTWVSGAPTFGKIHDSSIRSSHFTRNATNQNTPGAVHCTTLDFAYRVSVIGNLWDVIGGPITNTTRNDGETILSEGGGANRTENYGTVGSATATTMTDPSNTLNMDPFGTGSIPEDYGITIVAGKGAGQMRHIVSYANNTATVDHAWDSIPDGTSRYATSVFGLEQALIEGNTLSQNPRGIWLYNSSMRDIDVIGNTISEGGGIYVRVYQNLSSKYFTPIYGVLIKGNQISNTTRNWMSYINVVLTNGDGIAFGTGTIGIEVRNNTITANRPNVYSSTEEYASTEGMTARMPLESGGYYESTTIPRLLGTIFDSNTCNYCDVAVRLGTGANGTVINNTKLLGTPVLYTDTSSVPSGETSTATVVR
jgi:parallel beta-helix repeat protein